MRAFLFTQLQSVLPQHLLSRVAGYLAHQPLGAITHWAIRQFCKIYRVNLSEALLENPTDYATFNAFFTRTLKPGSRPLDTNPHHFVSPIDGTISQIGTLQADTLVQAKGFRYTVGALLGGMDHTASQFENGLFLTAYLAPRDYHRFHMPCDGTLIEMRHLPGRLFSVNPTTASQVPGLFSHNERVVFLFNTAQGPLALVAVGAMIVGGIAANWHGCITPPTQQAISIWDYRTASIELKKGELIGHFELGSTIILLLPPHMAAWQETLQAEVTLQQGTHIATLENV